MSETTTDVLEELATALDKRASAAGEESIAPQTATEDQYFSSGEAYAFGVSADLLRAHAHVLRERAKAAEEKP